MLQPNGNLNFNLIDVWGHYILFLFIFQMPHLIWPCMNPNALSFASYCALHYLVLLCALSFCMCVWLFSSRHRHRAVRVVRAGVRAHPLGGSRLYHYRWSDRRAPPLHLFLHFSSRSLLLSLCCDFFRVMWPIPLVYPNKPCIPSITYRPLFVVWQALRVVAHV